jgi:hypothetical protein
MGGLNPEIILQGNRYFEISVSKPGIITNNYFRDSLNWMAIKVSSMIETFDLKGLVDKPFFPYLFTKERNLGKTIDHLPPKEDYLYRYNFYNLY